MPRKAQPRAPDLPSSAGTSSVRISDHLHNQAKIIAAMECRTVRDLLDHVLSAYISDWEKKSGFTLRLRPPATPRSNPTDD